MLRGEPIMRDDSDSDPAPGGKKKSSVPSGGGILPQGA
jgi:hypothetical protein